VEWVLAIIQKYKYEPDYCTYREVMRAYSEMQKREEKTAEVLWDAREMVGADGRRRTLGSGFRFKVSEETKGQESSAV
jgi:hypothetical protein